MNCISALRVVALCCFSALIACGASAPLAEGDIVNSETTSSGISDSIADGEGETVDPETASSGTSGPVVVGEDETPNSEADNSEIEQPSMLPLAAKPVGRATLPSDVLKLSNWKLTLPVGKAERPTEIKQPMLRNFQDPTYFRLSEDKTGVVFRAHTGGTTTRGSGYPRSELREMANKGASTASWSTSSGMHRMYIKQAILKTPATKQHVVAGQIHDAKDDIVVIRLEKAKLFVDVNGRTGPTLDKAYTLGKVFEVEFVASDGKIDIFYNRGATPVYTLRKAAAGCYFKAGVYTQSNVATEGNRTAYGEVAIFDLRVSHQ